MSIFGRSRTLLLRIAASVDAYLDKMAKRENDKHKQAFPSLRVLEPPDTLVVADGNQPVGRRSLRRLLPDDGEHHGGNLGVGRPPPRWASVSSSNAR
jgi:hypothetical protein